MSKVSEKPAHREGESMASLAGGQWWRRDGVRLARLAVVVGLIAAGFLYLTWQAASPTVSGTSSCSDGPPLLDPGESPAPSSIQTIEQAYNCILDIYPAALDHRRLLQHAMSSIVNYLVQQNQDQRNAVLPALTGDRSADWQAFQRTYTALTAHLSLNQQPLVAAAIREMVNSLDDNHARYIPSQTSSAGGGSSSKSGSQFGLGIRLPFNTNQLAFASSPLFILDVDPGSPADQAGLRPGDIILTINGVSPFLNQRPVSDVISQLSAAQLILLQVQRPGAHGTRSISLVPGAYPELPLVSTRMLPGNILYVRLTEFRAGASQQISSAVQQAGGARLKALILDLRGNGGGDAQEQKRVISLFIHNQVVSTFVDKQGKRTDQKTDNSIPLLHIRLVALIDRGCASACDATAMDIHDLHLGRLVGGRTMGVVSGPSSEFLLDDGSALALPVAFMQGPAGEIVDGIGVPPDDEVYPTAAELAAGHDPTLEKALQDL